MVWLSSSLFLIASMHQQTAQNVPFASEITAFAKQDRVSTPLKGQIVFTGSSSFTRWTDVQDYYPGYPILNRAFGGSSLTDVIRFVDQVVLQYQPKEIVLYCGENDFAGDPKLPAYKVYDRFVTLIEIIRNKLPKTPIVYVCMKPSPSRWYMRAKFVAANDWIKQYCEAQPNLKFVDVWNAMLDEHGVPKPDIFLGDKLHMNAKGYHIWQPILAPYLIR